MHFFTAILTATTSAKELSCSDASGIPLIGGTVSGACKTVVGAANSVGSTVGNAVDISSAISTILGEFLKIFTDFVGFVKDFFFWFLHLFFPPELQTWFFGTVGLEPLHGGSLMGLNPNDPNNSFQNMFAVMVAPGLAIAVVASGVRILRTLMDPRSTSMNVVVDVLIRFFAVAVVLIPVNGVSLGYVVLAWSFNAAQLFSLDIGLHLLGAAMFKGAPAGSSVVEKIFFGFMNLPSAGATVAIGLLFWLIFVLYAVVMMMIRAILIGFCIAMAPLCVATAAFDNRNKFFAWWLDLFSGTLAIGPILTLAFWISFTMASSVIAGLAVVGPIVAIIIMIGSIWMAGKLIHQLTWKHFSHGGAIGAFGAAFGVLALSGKGAQSLGLVPGIANHPTFGPVLDFFKQMGYAAQGFNPERGGIPGGSIIPDGPAAMAMNNKHGANTGVVRGSEAGANGEPPVASPLELMQSEGYDVSPEEEEPLGAGVAALINTQEFAGVVGTQLAGDELIGNSDVTSASPGQRAQMYWDSLSRSEGGPVLQARLARQAYSHLLGSGGLADTGPLGGGGGGGGAGAGAGAGGGGRSAGGGGPAARAAAVANAAEQVRQASQSSGFGGGTPAEDTPGFFGGEEDS